MFYSGLCIHTFYHGSCNTNKGETLEDLYKKTLADNSMKSTRKKCTFFTTKLSCESEIHQTKVAVYTINLNKTRIYWTSDKPSDCIYIERIFTHAYSSFTNFCNWLVNYPFIRLHCATSIVSERLPKELIHEFQYTTFWQYFFKRSFSFIKCSGFERSRKGFEDVTPPAWIISDSICLLIWW